MSSNGYRVDSRSVELSNFLYPRNLDFVPEDKIKAREVERYLEIERPDFKPPRNRVLMVFDSLPPAKAYWLIIPDAHIYRVSYETSDLLHTGDHATVELLFEEVLKGSDEEKLQRIAKSYWHDTKVRIPEIFVSKAKVEEILSTPEDRSKELASRIGFKASPEKIAEEIMQLRKKAGLNDPKKLAFQSFVTKEEYKRLK